ncbi:hypothetical protein BGZ65_004010 [Modicella reniformis]|uniref:Uncharacterized protein n=1 Tax=Modicella reniformis TaxID=1440133 RepID=A0A9P6IKF5_9FUNG|nr:hypothetical protein BGZ65_004010 [Modicella reniformis]
MGQEPRDPKGWAARSIAEKIISVSLDMNPVKGDLDVALSVVQKSMSHQVAAHFRRLPSVIRSKLKSCGVPEESLPAADDNGHEEADDERDDDDEEDGDDDEDEDAGGEFNPGTKDTSILFSEEALLNILWGGKQNSTTHPTRRIMDKLMDKKTATELFKDNYGSFGDQARRAADAIWEEDNHNGSVSALTAGNTEFQATNLREHVREVTSYRSELYKRKDPSTSCKSAPPARTRFFA